MNRGPKLGTSLRSTFWTALLNICLMACTPASEQREAIEPRDIPKIDIHTHFRYAREYMPDLFERWNMQALLVDVAKADSSGIERRWDAQFAHAQAYPDLFYLCTAFEGSRIDDADFSAKVIAQLREDIEAGARMVKVWKNFGMVTRDGSGAFIQIDDVRLQPIWDFLVARDIPVIAHIAEPVQAWRPLDDPSNPHYGYYNNNPQYHAYQHPEIPSYETIIAARDRWIAQNADLTILGAHVGSMSHDVGMVAERLDQFPNFYVETAARFGDLAGQDSEVVRDFFIKYQDRVLFGTDYANSTPQDELSAEALKKEQENLEERYALLWQYLTTSDSLTIRKQATKGLDLPKDVLEKFYYVNAAKLLQFDK